MSPRKTINPTIILTNVPDRLKAAYRIYMALPVEEKININQGMILLMDKCSNMGPLGAFEVVHEIGLFLAKKERYGSKTYGEAVRNEGKINNF